MNPMERTDADFRNTGLSIGRHPITSYYRREMDEMGVISAAALRAIPNGRWVRIAGSVICRQRPGTARGFLFISLEDETGIANAIVEPELFDERRTPLVDAPYLRVDGVLQNQDGVINVRARHVQSLDIALVRVGSHDFH